MFCWKLEKQSSREGEWGEGEAGAGCASCIKQHTLSRCDRPAHEHTHTHTRTCSPAASAQQVVPSPSSYSSGLLDDGATKTFTRVEWKKQTHTHTSQPRCPAGDRDKHVPVYNYGPTQTHYCLRSSATTCSSKDFLSARAARRGGGVRASSGSSVSLQSRAQRSALFTGCHRWEPPARTQRPIS